MNTITGPERLRALIQAAGELYAGDAPAVPILKLKSGKEVDARVLGVAHRHSPEHFFRCGMPWSGRVFAYADVVSCRMVSPKDVVTT